MVVMVDAQLHAMWLSVVSMAVVSLSRVVVAPISLGVCLSLFESQVGVPLCQPSTADARRRR